MPKEDDGSDFYKDSTQQTHRNQLKNYIPEKYIIPLLGLPANSSHDIENAQESWLVDKADSD